MKKLREVKNQADWSHTHLHINEVEVILRCTNEKDDPIEIRHVLEPMSSSATTIMQRRPVKMVKSGKKLLKAKRYDFLLYDLAVMVKSSKMSLWK